MEQSLINPNKCRAFEVSLYDDPTDRHRTLGIHSNDINITLYMDDTIATIDTRRNEDLY